MLHLLALLGSAQAQPLVAIVVVDQEARDSGYALEIDGWLVEDALPVDVAAGERVALVDSVGRAELLDLAPGEAWEVTGADGEAWMSKLDEEIRTDLIVVRGSEASIEALAESLNADVFSEDGRIYLSGKDILLDAPWVEDEAALEVEEVALVRVEAEAAEGAEPEQTGVFTPAPARIPTRSLAAATPAGLSSPAPAVDPPSTEAEGQAEERVAPELPRVEPEARPELRDDHPARYAGLHLCRDDVLWLHPSGTYAFRGVDGVWSVATPGVVRLLTDDGQVLFRASIDPKSRFCRDVWSPEETGDPMPAGYERFSKRKRGPAL